MQLHRLLTATWIATLVKAQAEAPCPDGIGNDTREMEPATFGKQRMMADTGHNRHRSIIDRILAPRASGQKFVPYSTQQGQCIDVQGANLNSGSRVQLWQCSGGGNQQWRIEGPLFQTNNDMCLDVPYGNAYDGAPLQVWKCDGANKNQKWNQLGSTLQWSASQKYCVDVPGGNFRNGNLLQLWTCYAGSANQAFAGGDAPATGNVGSTNQGSNFYGYACISLDDFVRKHPECAPYKGALQSAAADQGLNPVFLGAIAMIESTCGAGLANSPNKRFGPYQFMDDRAWNFYGGAGKNRENFWDAAYGAARYFNALLQQTNGNLYNAMRNYNGQVQDGGDPNYQSNAANFMNGNR